MQLMVRRLGEVQMRQVRDFLGLASFHGGYRSQGRATQVTRPPPMLRAGRRSAGSVVDSATVAFGAASVLGEDFRVGRKRVLGTGHRRDTKPSSSCKAPRTTSTPSRSCVAMTGRSK